MALKAVALWMLTSEPGRHQVEAYFSQKGQYGSSVGWLARLTLDSDFSFGEAWRGQGSHSPASACGHGIRGGWLMPLFRGEMLRQSLHFKVSYEGTFDSLEFLNH